MDKKIQNKTSADAIDSEKKSSEKKPASFSSDTPFFWQKPKYQAVIIILFSLAIGHAWHIRGSGPWGGMTGMWAVGIFTVLLIFLIFGNRKRATPTWIGILVVLFALTVGGWGTLNKQTTGRLVDTGFYDIT